MTGSNDIDKTGIPVVNSVSDNGYSVELTDYCYGKINEIDNDNDFSASEIEEYGLNANNNKINISTTGKLIKYLKSFVKVCVGKIQSEHDDYVEQMEIEIARLENAIDSVETTVLNKIYPVGSVYMTFDSTNPSILFGGSWVELENRFLLGSGSRNVGDMDGEEEHVLSVNEMPSHNHTQNAHKHHLDNNYYFLGVKQSDNTRANFVTTSTFYRFNLANDNGYASIMYTQDAAYVYEPYNTANATPTINNSGNNQGHNNMPPYIVVHMWRRIA